MSEKTSPPIALEARDAEDGRLFSPSAGRNKAAIAAILADHLPSAAHVLEIGSGTGEHAAALLDVREDVIWQPSDPDAASRRSQSSWGSGFGGRVTTPLALDLCQPGWTEGLGLYDALISCNVIHISPPRVLGEIAGSADQLLKPGGCVILYGPFLEGEATATSNLAFDQSLKARNPQWGVRSLDAVIDSLKEGGFAALTRTRMPANNQMLIFERTGPSHAPS